MALTKGLSHPSPALLLKAFRILLVIYFYFVFSAIQFFFLLKRLFCWHGAAAAGVTRADPFGVTGRRFFFSLLLYISYSTYTAIDGDFSWPGRTCWMQISRPPPPRPLHQLANSKRSIDVDVLRFTAFFFLFFLSFPSLSRPGSGQWAACVLLHLREFDRVRQFPPQPI